MHVFASRKFEILALCLFITVVVGEFRSLERTRRHIPKEWRLDKFTDIVRKTGYPAEEHDIVTKDGYILKLHRMPGGPLSPPAQGKPVVIFLHGLFASSEIFVIMGPGKDLAYLLVDAGYDVWLLNARGNVYSRHHVRLSPKNPEFWRFSWHEIGVSDTTAVIDYVLPLTGLKKVSLIGHSMGTTVSFALLSERPKYNEKVNVVICLAPVATFTNGLSGIGGLFVTYKRIFEKLLKANGLYEFFPFGLTNAGLLVFCTNPATKTLCVEIFYDLLGNPEDLENQETVISSLLQHYPTGSSLDVVLHFLQIIHSREFNLFDFGPTGNLEHYGRLTPPEYQLNRISVPIVSYYGKNDQFTTPSNIAALEKKLPNATSMEIPYVRFNHVDYLFSKSAKELLFDDMIKVLQRYTK